jgi:type IV pilus assembly protein PilV
MIAVVILTIGLLGLGSLQIIGFRLTSDSLLRTTAAVLANDMVDRMRANVTATSLGITSPYNNPSGATAANPSCLGMNSSGGSANTSCSSTQMAGQDFYEWTSNISGAPATSWYPAVPAMLPQGSGVVCIDSTPDDGSAGNPACDGIVVTPGKPIFAIKLWWVERKNAQAPGTPHQYTVSFSL